MTNQNDDNNAWIEPLLKKIENDIDPQPKQVRVHRGDIVETLGPWSNGHTEQAAIVTYVYGLGIAGDRVNLHIFVDESDSLTISRVPFYPTEKQAKDSTMALPEHTDIIGAPGACYFPTRD